jgi:hypothetical protein
MEVYDDLVEKGHKDVLVMREIPTDVNVYITKRQMEQQKLEMTQREQDRWHAGDLAAAFADAELDERLFEQCRSKVMDEEVDRIGTFDDTVGLVQFETPWQPGHDYVVVGDVGQNDLAGLGTMNVPCVMVFEVTDFLEKPCKMVAFYWFSGNGSYKKFVKVMKSAMMRYRAYGYYDATNVATALEDFQGSFEEWPTTPIFFSGTVGPKRWAIAIAVQLMQDGLFEWPYIKGMWYQARIFDASSRTQPDDVIATLLVFALSLRVEGVLWDALVNRYHWEVEDDEDDELAQFRKFHDEEVYVAPDDRYSRLLV